MPTKARNALAIFLVGLCAAIPLVQRGMPVGVDTYLHLLRMPHLDTLLREGILFTRWYPFMIGGYGYPLFNYYPPLGYYPIELLHLSGLSQFAAFKLYWAAGLFIAAGGAFLWGNAIFSPPALRERGGGLPAITLAIAYVCSPFLLNEVYWRGGLSQYTAHILLPYLFWLAERIVHSKDRRYRVGFALILAAIVTAHNVTALVVFPYLLVYLLILLVMTQRFSLRHVGKIGLSLALGLGLSAWYWLPALLETDLIQVERVTQAGIMSYVDNFQSLRTLFALPTFYDARQLNLDPPRALHWGAVLLAGVAWFGLSRQGWEERVRVMAATGAAIFGVWMMLPSSEFVWQNLPLIHFLQFPFRFWGITTLLIAMLAAYGVRTLPENRWLIAAIWLGLLSYAAPWSFDEYEPIAEPTLADSIAFELETGLLGLSSATEYLPLDVGTLPSLDEWRLTDDDVAIVESGALRHVVSSSAEKLTFNIFYFPGWHATLDGDPIPIYPQPPHGLIALDLPAGEQTVELAWKSTPPRQIGSVLSIISLVGLVMIGVVGGWRRSDVWRNEKIIKKRSTKDTKSTKERKSSLFLRVSWCPSWTNSSLPRVGSFRQQQLPIPETQSIATPLLFALLLFALLRLVILEPVWAESTRFDGVTVAAVAAPQNINFGNQVQLIGMADLPTFAIDETIELALYWQPIAPKEEDLSVIITLRDSLGFVVGESSKLHIGDFPTRRWEAGNYALDRHTLTLKNGTPPSEYRVEATIYQYDNPTAQISVLDAAGNPQGETVEIGRVTVVRPKSAPDVIELERAQTVVEGVGLISAEIPQSTYQVGTPLTVNFLWQALADDLPDRAFPLVLLSSIGEEYIIAQIQPVPDYPASAWRKGEQWRGRHSILLPADLPTGRYLVLADAIDLGAIDIIIPERMFDQPMVASAQNVPFGDVAELIGYTLREADGALQVELVWRAVAETTNGYKSFVQILDANGAFLAGSDQVPAQWSRPTTSWLTGEYVVDTHNLPLLENGSQLAIGLYDMETLERLKIDLQTDVLISPLP